jgi:DNA (cytosine-5)-methyltransferase 1
MLIQVRENDDRPRFVQGLETIAPEEVLRARECIFTNFPYGQLGQSHVNARVPLRLQSRNDIRRWLFHHGKLICRWVLIIELDHNEKSYAGEVRSLYKREAADFSGKAPAGPLNSLVQETPMPSTGAQVLPQKSSVLTMSDIFCGVGGVTEAAIQAGYKVILGLDVEPSAMEAYRKNHPGVLPLTMNAHDFPAKVKRCIHGCDHVHLSCPCCYWSEAQ